ncbi:MAG: hypothetical protein IT269_00805 [Saprospiraceae bacterium]|nr:hypothetical protein [Saprospiraceae bacterium]
MKKSVLLLGFCLIAMWLQAQNNTPSNTNTNTDPITIKVNLDANPTVQKVKNWFGGGKNASNTTTTPQNQRTEPAAAPVNPNQTISAAPARGQVNVDASLNGDWKMIVTPTEQLSKDGQRQNASGTHEIGIALKIQDSRITGEYTWAKGVCATAHLEGQMTGQNTFEAVVEYNGSCCGGTKMKINGQFTGTDSFTAKFKPEGRPASFCYSWWAGIQGIKE